MMAHNGATFFHGGCQGENLAQSFKIENFLRAVPIFLCGPLAWRGAGYPSMGPRRLAKRAGEGGQRGDPDVLQLWNGGGRNGAAAVNLCVHRREEVPHVLLHLVQYL